MSNRKRGGRWWVDFSYNGLRYRFPSPENSLAGCKAHEALARQKLANGENISIMGNAIDHTCSFKEFSEKWFELYVKTNNKPSEIKRKRYTLSSHLVPYFGKYQLTDIRSLSIEEYKTYKLKKCYNPKSINNHLSVLAKCLRTALDWEITKTVPRIKMLKSQPNKFDHLTQEESEQLLSTATGKWHDMILTALYTGVRIGELLALSWEDVNLKDKVLTVKNSFSAGILSSTKSNRIRYIPLVDELCELLESLQQDTGFIFIDPENNNYPSPEACRRNLGWICEKANLRHIGWHTLRHTFASRLAANSINIIAIKDLMGHSEIRTTMRYVHLAPHLLRDAIMTLQKSPRHKNVTTPNFEENFEANLLTKNINFFAIDTKKTSY
ncbi:MAG: site-specific integrase [Patescibacteria group bacterium]